MARHRFRPRYRGLAWGAAGLGAGLGAISWAAPPIVLVTGVCGLLLGGAYLASPTWRLAVETSEDALAVVAGSRTRFSLPWTEVQAVVASRATRTCFVNGGVPERSLLVPGDGAPAPYRLERREELFDFILAHVPEDKVESVELLSDRLRG
ncbi:MAG: hypothetical protein R3B48_06530 [Kofleriaceae bacterium]